MDKLTTVYVPVNDCETGLAICVFSERDCDYRFKEKVEKQSAYVHSPEELLELKKKWCKEGFEAGYKRGSDEVNVITPEGHIYPDKETFINNLKLD